MEEYKGEAGPVLGVIPEKEVLNIFADLQKSFDVEQDKREVRDHRDIACRWHRNEMHAHHQTELMSQSLSPPPHPLPVLLDSIASKVSLYVHGI